jgi:glucose/mannose transport system substrate-binding protein
MRNPRATFLGLTAVATAAVLALSACSSSKSTGSKASPGANTGANTDTKVEVFSWWTGGGEAAGLQALIADYKKNNAGVDFINATVAGGAGTNAKAVLQSRLKAGNPPDSFQGHAGAELQDYIKAGQVEPLDDFYKAQGLDNAFPKQLIDEISYQGHVYSVPANIHRANVLWWNPTVVTKAGITSPPKSVAEFIADLGKIKASDPNVLPISVGDQWTTEHLWETVMIGDLGADGWDALWKPGGNWADPKVTQAINDFKTIMSFCPAAQYSASWQDASKEVIDGKAAYNVMGDWAAGYFTGSTASGNLNKQPHTDFEWAAAPGTDGIYDWLSDSFTLAKGAPHPTAAKAWLAEIGSKSGQDIFNPLKGSIPARTDEDKSLYTGYLAWALDEWGKDKLVGSFYHGVVANNTWHGDIEQAEGVFLKDWNVSSFQSALVTAAQNDNQ